MSKRINKLALVTGASRKAGIGAAIARELACDGIDVFMTYFCPYDQETGLAGKPEEPQMLLTALQKMGCRAGGLEIDLSEPNAPRQLFDHVEAFTVSLSAEVGSLGITVNAVDPGITDTGWIPPELKTKWKAESPMGRVGAPEDAARLIRFLASEDAAWITGQIIHSRGGL